MKSMNIIHYGERGIVNALVNHISSKGNFVENIKTLLQTIKWAKEPGPVWIEKLVDAKIIVELGLAHFGDPDLIIVCKTTEQKTYVVFIEVKVIPYEKSKIPNSIGMKHPHFNSSINGQLSLKYRFARALSTSSDNRIEETEEIYAHYKEQLNDKLSIPRNLNKAEIIEKILKFKEFDVTAIPEDNFHYVAWTWDRENRVFFKNPAVGEDDLPLFLDDGGNQCFSDLQSRIGWLGFNRVKHILDLEHNDEFLFALETMGINDDPTDGNYAEYQSKKLDTFSEPIQDLAKSIHDEINNRCECKSVKLTGSYSIMMDNTTIGKIILLNNKVFVGIRKENMAEPEIKDQKENQKLQGVFFFGSSINSIDQINEIIETELYHLT